MVQIRPPKKPHDSRKRKLRETLCKPFTGRGTRSADGRGCSRGAVSGRLAAGQVLGKRKNTKGGWYMGQETNAALRHKLRAQIAAIMMRYCRLTGL